MACFRFIASRALRWLPVVLCAMGAKAQSCLVLSAPVLGGNGTASLDLALYSKPGSEPAAVEWTFQYPSGIVRGLTVDDGPALGSAGKATFCAGDAAGYKCLAVGVNTKTIDNGIIARVTVVLAPDASAPTIRIKSSLGVSPLGLLIPVSAKILSAAGAQVPSDCGPQK